MNNDVNLTVEQVARIAGCHRNTVLNYESRGFIQSYRDNNNFRRYTQEDAKKLKQLLDIRRPAES
jgi:DNA-binding transcriptional MerR regulator